MNDLAQGRIGEAKELAGLAEERTLTSWLRTGLTMIGVGLGAAKLLPGTAVPWLPRLLGIVLTAGGGAVFLLGFHTYRRSLHSLRATGCELAPDWFINGVTGVLVLAALLALILVLF